MALYLSNESDSDSAIYIAPLTNDKIDYLSGDIEDVSGYFLYRWSKTDATKCEILARAISEEAAMELARMLELR